MSSAIRSDGPPLTRALAPWQATLPTLVAEAGGAPVVVACSGGADSLALLALTRGAGVDAVAVHIDHGLRAGSADEAQVVMRAAEGLGVVVRADRIHVAPGPGVEARARAERHAALETARLDVGAGAIFLGHTMDDQAETAVLHFLRGSGVDGLAGIPERRGVVVHPLLGIRRADTVEICARLGWSPVDDPMNDDPAYRRVFVRRRVLPELERAAARDLVPVLARQAATFAAERAELDRAATVVLRAAGEGARDDALSVAVLLGAPPAIAGRALRIWLGAPPIGTRAVERVAEVVRGERVAVECPGGRWVRRSGGRLRREGPGSDAPGDAVRASPVPVVVPGHTVLTAGSIDAAVDTDPPTRWPDGRAACVLDAATVGADLRVRTVQAGDRLKPVGMTGHKAVREVLAEAGVPPAARERALVAVHGPTDEVLWVVGYRVAAAARASRSTRRFLRLTFEPAGGTPV